MRSANVLFKNEDAGILTQHDDASFTFRYHDSWIADTNKPGICLNLPKNETEFHDKYLFPYFFNLLPEGTNKQVACKLNRIDEDDDFGLLMVVAQNDTIGAVRVIAN